MPLDGNISLYESQALLRLRRARDRVAAGWNRGRAFDIVRRIKPLPPIQNWWPSSDGLVSSTACMMETYEQPLFCAGAAISYDENWCAPAGWGDDVERAAVALARAIGLREPCEISTWNDNRTRSQEDVIAAFDRAIALVEAEDAALNVS